MAQRKAHWRTDRWTGGQVWVRAHDVATGTGGDLGPAPWAGPPRVDELRAHALDDGVLVDNHERLDDLAPTAPAEDPPAMPASDGEISVPAADSVDEGLTQEAPVGAMEALEAAAAASEQRARRRRQGGDGGFAGPSFDDDLNDDEDEEMMLGGVPGSDEPGTARERTFSGRRRSGSGGGLRSRTRGGAGGSPNSGGFMASFMAAFFSWWRS